MSSPPRSNDPSRSAGLGLPQAGEASLRGSAGASAPSAPSTPPAPSTQPIDLAGLDGLPGEAIALFCWSDVRPLQGVLGFVDWRLCGAVSRTIEKGFFTGGQGETLLLPAARRMSATRLFVFGIGARSAWDAAGLRRACRRAAEVIEQAGALAWRLASPACSGNVRIEQAFVQAAVDELGPQNEAILVERLKGAELRAPESQVYRHL